VFPVASLLNNGNVLISEGVTTMVYVPGAGFSATGSLITPRTGFTMTTLPSGKVLIAGGNPTMPIPIPPPAELYDPAMGTFSETGFLITARTGHTATLLANGKVLILGGGVASAELYDPITGLFTPTTPLLYSRSGHRATLLPGGRIFVSGGGSGATPFTEIYTPAP
jgi:hypothetical protein